MVVHDKVYNCTSFVDEHPYVFPSDHPNLLPERKDKREREREKKASHNNNTDTRLTKSSPINSGGEEVMLDVGGQDATEAFEDVGHSDEAREILQGLLVGTIKRQPGDPSPKASAQPTGVNTKGGPDAAGLGAGLYAILLVGGALAYFAYSYLQANGSKQQL
jgi:hypothetical protein